MPQIAWFYNRSRDAFFRDGKIRVTINYDDGSAMGLVGGYRDWRDLYAQNVFAQDGGQQGVREHEDHIALYYALRRHADGMFNSKTGRYDGVSSVYLSHGAGAGLCRGPRQADGHPGYRR